MKITAKEKKARMGDVALAVMASPLGREDIATSATTWENGRDRILNGGELARRTAAAQNASAQCRSIFNDITRARAALIVGR